VRRITVTLEDDERKALQDLAEAERRHPSDQAAILIRRELERERLLEPPEIHTEGSVRQRGLWPPVGANGQSANDRPRGG